MRWILLGGDREADELQRRFAGVPELELVRQSASDWESLLVQNDFDAVFVTPGLDESLRSEQLKKLVSSGICVIAMHPAADILMAYEIEVLRRDAAGTIVAFAPGWNHPAWDRLCEIIAGDGSPIGRTEHVSFERNVNDRQRTAVLAQLNQDVHVLRRLLGNITSINAVGDSRDDGSWTSLTVHFASDSGRSANWSLAPPSAEAESRVRMTGNQGSVSLLIPSDTNRAWELRDSAGHQQVFNASDDIHLFVARVRETISGRAALPSWSEICLDLEVAEAAEKSLRRKRAIDLFTTNRSEEKTFKGFMAATGCLVLLAILIGFLTLALWDGFRSPFRGPVQPGRLGQPADGWPLWLRLWPVYPLLAFLLLQFLLLITRRPQSERRSD